MGWDETQSAARRAVLLLHCSSSCFGPPGAVRFVDGPLLFTRSQYWYGRQFGMLCFTFVGHPIASLSRCLPPSFFFFRPFCRCPFVSFPFVLYRLPIFLGCVCVLSSRQLCLSSKWETNSSRRIFVPRIKQPINKRYIFFTGVFIYPSTSRMPTFPILRHRCVASKWNKKKMKRAFSHLGCFSTWPYWRNKLRTPEKTLKRRKPRNKKNINDTLTMLATELRWNETST